MDQGADLFGTIFERGECIFRQGDPGETMYLVQTGAVEIVHHTGEDVTVLALLEPGEFFGEMALLDNRPRSSAAVAAMRTRLVSFTRGSLLERLGRDPAVAMHLLRVSRETFLDRIKAQPRFGLALLQVLTYRLRRSLDSPPPPEDATTAKESGWWKPRAGSWCTAT